MVEDAKPRLRPSDVFVVGGLPKHTYYARPDLRLEERLREYLEERHKIISLTGPTKSGKSVLVKKVVGSDAVSISGGSVQTEAEFWEEVSDKAGGTNSIQRKVGETATGTWSGAVTGELGLPGVGKVGSTVTGTKADASVTESNFTRTVSPKAAALAALKHYDPVLVIDDFHYIPRPIQLNIIRALKDPIFDGLRVIALAVPHRGYDVMRTETEMTGRVIIEQVPQWDMNELMAIPNTGFPLLATSCQAYVAERFAKEAYGSPHLMQDFCLRYAKLSGLGNDLLPPKILPPPDFDSLFLHAASSAAKPAFNTLKRGPKRTDRMERELVGGSKADIYVAVLLAISKVSIVKERLGIDAIRAALKEILAEEPPQGHEVVRVLVKMTEIAADMAKGDSNDPAVHGIPVLEWVEDDRELHIIDPFFAFYLRWGAAKDLLIELRPKGST